MRGADVAAALRRGWWLVVGLPVVVAAFGLYSLRDNPTVYQARIGLALDVPPELIVPTSDAGAAKVGETLVDDISRIVGGDRFAIAVAARLESLPPWGPGSDDQAVTAGEIASSLSATDRHRVLDITVTRALAAGAPTGSPDALRHQLNAIASAAAEELAANGGDWFALLGARGARLTVVDGPVAGAAPPSLRSRLEMPLRIAAAAALGAALAIALWALDPRVRSDAEAARVCGAPILGRVRAGRRE
jgi:uncharacterized protein involved in exopolysaccharide biosynthesis